jgi:hypothetical protein
MYGRPGTKLEVKPAEWQREAYRLYDVVGAARFVANTVANAVSRCRLYIAKLDPDTGEILGEADDEALKPYVASPFGTGDRRRENVRLAALNLFVCGEYFQVGEGARGEGERDRWYVVSPFDFKKKKGGGGSEASLLCDRPPMYGGGEAVLDPGTDKRKGRDVVSRTWTPHPMHSREADSPFRAAIPDLNILHTIKKRESAELDSRLAGAGILFVPDSFTLPGKDGNPGTVQDLMDDLIEIASEVISDPSHPSSIIPYILKVPGEDIEKVKLINFWSELSAALGELSDRKIRALAQAFDAPVETLEGAGNTNHWNLWRIAEETITTHYEPLLSRMADSITTVYLRPGLTTTSLNPDEYAYAFDTTPLRVRADRFGDAVKLRELGLLSDAATLKAGDFTDADAPGKKEKAERLARELVLANPELAAGPLGVLAGLDINERIIIDGTTTPEPAPAAPAVEPTPRAVQGPPQQRDGSDAPTGADTLTASLLAQLPNDAAVTVLANTAVHRALEYAGGRLVKTWPRGADRARLHTTLTTPPNKGQAQRALAGVWDNVPNLAAGLDVDTDQLTNALNAYTVELIVRGRDHEPEALGAILGFARLTGASHAR